jgi:hypothetical protein
MQPATHHETVDEEAAPTRLILWLQMRFEESAEFLSHISIDFVHRMSSAVLKVVETSVILID